MKTKLKIIISLLALSGGCTPIEQQTIVDQCLRQEIFKQCMEALPNGPQSVGLTNDWAEVVSACGEQGFYQARRKKEFVKPECAI